MHFNNVRKFRALKLSLSSYFATSWMTKKGWDHCTLQKAQGYNGHQLLGLTMAFCILCPHKEASIVIYTWTLKSTNLKLVPISIHVQHATICNLPKLSYYDINIGLHGLSLCGKKLNLLPSKFDELRSCSFMSS
jgi:hypothetical protein